MSKNLKKITKANELKELSEELGFDLPEIKSKSYKNAGNQEESLVQFAIDNGFVISPVGYLYFAESFLMFGHCPCNADRKKCPCNEAVDEVSIKGKCLCHLFWRDYETFKKEKF